MHRPGRHPQGLSTTCEITARLITSPPGDRAQITAQACPGHTPAMAERIRETPLPGGGARATRSCPDRRPAVRNGKEAQTFPCDSYPCQPPSRSVRPVARRYRRVALCYPGEILHSEVVGSRYTPFYFSDT